MNTGPEIRSDISEKLNSLSPYSCGKQNKNVLLPCQNPCWFCFRCWLSFQTCNAISYCKPPFHWILYLHSCSLYPIVHRHAFLSLYFGVVLFSYHIWRWFDEVCWFSLLQVQRHQLKQEPETREPSAKCGPRCFLEKFKWWHLSYSAYSPVFKSAWPAEWTSSFQTHADTARNDLPIIHDTFRKK